VARIDALGRELDDVAKDLSALATQEVGPLNEELGNKKLQPLPAV